LGLFLFTGFANTVHHHVDLFHGIAPGQVYCRDVYIVKANRFTALFTPEMYMVVVMVPCCDTGFVAKRIPDHVVCGRDVVDDALFKKGLKRSINRNAVVLVSTSCFNVLMGQGIVSGQKDVKYPLSAGRYTERAVLQYVFPLLFHLIP